jgi:autotransporter-associated beta strand protein
VSALTLSGGTLELAGVNLAYNRNTTVSGDAAIVVDRIHGSTSNSTHTLGTLGIGDYVLNVSRGSFITGAGMGGLTFGATSLSGSPTFSVDSNALLTLGALNDGATARTLTKSGAGTLTLAAPALSLLDGTVLDVTAGTLNSNHATALGTAARVNISSGATIALGATQAFGALAGAGLISLDSNTLTVGGSSNLSSVYSGALSGAGALTKAGTGALTLSGANTYTGATAINAGTLFVNGTLANTAVTVATGATLGGSGTIAGATAFQSGAHLAPGNSPGTLSFTNSLTLVAGSILDFQLGTTSDLIRVSGGTLTGPSSGFVTLNLTDAGGFDPLTGGTFTLFNFSGATLSNFDAADFTFGSLLSGTTLSGYSLNLDAVGKTLSLTYSASAVPEPSTYAAFLGALALGVAAWRRRRPTA